MSKAHSLASKKRWSKIPKSVRSRIMTLTVKHRWKHASPDQKREVGLRLVEARKKNK